METCIAEDIAPARRAYLLLAAGVAGLALLAALTAFVKLGASHVWAPLSAFPALAILLGLVEMHLRSKTKRKWILRDEGLILTTNWKTETILWQQIRTACKCLPGLSLTYETFGDATKGVQTRERTELLYVDDSQRQELLAVISARACK
jgi:hypothetical protein